MDIERDESESQPVVGSQRLSTPLRAALPRLQPPSQDNQVNQADQWRSETLYSVPVQWTPSLAGLKDILAVAHANSLPQEAGRPSPVKNQPESTSRETMQHWQLFEVDIKSAGLDSSSTQQIHNHHGLSDCSYHDLNMPPLTTEEANFHKNKSQFAPFTPDKTIRSEKQKIDAKHFSASLNKNPKKGNEVTGTMSSATPQVGKNLPFTTSSAPSKETDNEAFDGIDPNKTPAKKERRKRHRPKVINEGKSRTHKTPKPTTSKDFTKPKRKYVRKKGLDKATFVKVNAGSTVQNMREGTNSSCKKVLDFDIEGEQKENGAQKTPNPTTSKGSTKPKRNYVKKKGLDKATAAKLSAESTVQNMKGTNSSCKKVLAFDNEGEQMGNGATPKEPSSLPGRIATPTKTTCPPKTISADLEEGRTNLRARVGVDARTGMWTEAAQAKRYKRNHPHSTEKVSGSINPNDAHSKSTIAYGTSAYLVPFPDIHKKRRTEKVHCHTAANTSSMTATINIVEVGTTSIQNAAKTNLIFDASNCNFAQGQFGSGLEEPNRAHSHRKQSTQEILAANHPKRRTSTAQDQNNFPSKTAERSPEQIYANDATLTDCVDALATRQKIDDLQRHYSCVEALAAETATLTTKRTKMTSVVNSGYLRTQESPAQIFIYDPSGSPKDECNDMLIKQLQHLDINKEIQQLDQPQDAVIPYNKQNALVLYKREGKMVPYEGSFDPVKKRHPRPKVELDEETNRVWKLLLEDINSEGIDGTNKENMKRWEQEREVFRERANSFIARMRLVQGDRHFSPWKGSVVDSVVGVFLTQNVTDHVSSSAFMALAARFPRTSEKATSIVTDIIDLNIFDSEDFQKCIPLYKPFCEPSNMTLNSVETDEESKAVNSSESSRSIKGQRKAADDTASSQNSADTTNRQTGENIGLCSKNSQPKNATNRLNSRESNRHASFMELLQIQGFAMPYEVYSHDGTKVLPKVPNAVPNQTPRIVDDTHRHRNEIFNLYKSNTKKKVDPSSNYQLLQNTNPGFVFQSPDVTINRESAAFMNNNEDANSMYNKHAAKVGAAGCSAAPDIMSKTSVHEAPEFSAGPPNKGTFCFFESLHGDSSRFSAESTSRKQGDSLQQHENLSYRSSKMGDVTETTSTFGHPSRREHKTAEPNIKLHASKITSGGTTISRSKQEAKKKIEAFDWDSLRREVESDGKRKRTDTTMDSLDWEAVRTAKVYEIAETIKERGMNYVLAERIKAFLNRLVEEHGSIDLEWLRDVPPDKAKEYLLSIRGLGLKSAECVRLLTLHHIAFPVDTNVGRIAVRLGWVPLQPLPELLQIHLLELYPMLESIQKYLWPRLCKLDQKTLYELHYQLITFGKVFCTKTKPNCKACPMRGECRHFASAFASARLALPAPAGRRVNVAENGAGRQNPAAIDHIPLPLPQGSELPRDIHQLDKISGPSSIEPIIEVPGTPEPEDGQALETDIEDAIRNNSKGIPTIEMEDFKQNLQIHLDGEMSKALVALTPESASIPNPKLKNVSRLRTEHQVYELPDSHPLLSHLDKREPDDPCSYLCAIWKPGETASCTEPPQKTCNSRGTENLCSDIKCFSCNSIREAITQTVRGTILVPCRTAMKGSFPLNGTYFQVNEVFADHESSYSPIIVPRDWLWNLPRRTVYFGTSVSSIFKGLDTGNIQHCFWRGYVCVRGFEQKTRAPRPLALRFHCSPSQYQGKDNVDDRGQPPKSKIPNH